MHDPTTPAFRARPPGAPASAVVRAAARWGLSSVVLATAGSLVLATAAAAAPRAAAPATPAGRQLSCPVQLDVQYQKISRYAPDGAGGALGDFQPRFEPRTGVRLLAVHLAAAHGGSGKPTEILPPDELSFVPGRPARWSLWNGSPPEPTEEIFVFCDYEGGMRLQLSLGKPIRGCTLASAGQKPGPKSSGTRTVLTRADFSCR